MENLSIGIVLYNPNIDFLTSNIEELSIITNKIILVDNGSNNIDEIEEKFLNKVILIRNEKNLGIAKALNQLLDKAYELKSDYLLTLDQDSKLPCSMIANMISNISENTAIVCPIINDLNKSQKIEQKDEIEDVDRCITSGSLMVLSECKQIGYFDEKMFIDYVDFDYCKRIKIAKKRILRCKSAVINHEIGKRSVKKFFAWKVFPTNHNYIRVFYYSRNIKYYMKKYNKEMNFKEKNYHRICLLWKFISILLYEKEKKLKIKYYFKGLKDSKKMEGI